MKKYKNRQKNEGRKCRSNHKAAAVLTAAVIVTAAIFVIGQIDSSLLPVRAGAADQLEELLASEETTGIWQQQKYKMLEALDTMKEMGLTPGGAVGLLRTAYETRTEEDLEETVGDAMEDAREQVTEKVTDLGGQAVQKTEEKAEEAAENVIAAFFRKLQESVEELLRGNGEEN